MGYTKNQIRYFTLFMFNLAYNFVPFFYFKNLLLKVVGNKIGSKSYIHCKTRFFCLGRLDIGNNVTINFGSFLDARMGIEIGNNVMIAHNAKIYTLGHDFNSPTLANSGAKIRIKNNACIFSNVMIMPGVTVEEGTVILPGAVITKNTEPFSVYGGIPAKKIGTRNKEIDYKINYGYWFAN